MRVLVTGATGLIGRGTTASLCVRGHEVVSMIRPGRETPPGTTALVHDLVDHVDPYSLDGIDCVVHLAHHPHVAGDEHANALYRLNTCSTQELLDAARAAGVGRFVYASSGAVYGASPVALDEDAPLRADDYYALTKRHAEELVDAYSSHFDTTVLRPFFPYGPGQEHRLVPRLAERILGNLAVELHDDERPHVNPIYVDDAVDAVVAASEGLAPRVLNLAGPDIVSIRELAVEIGSAVGREPRFLPRPDPAEGDFVGATTRLAAVLGRPLVPLREGLAQALAKLASATP